MSRASITSGVIMAWLSSTLKRRLVTACASISYGRGLRLGREWRSVSLIPCNHVLFWIARGRSPEAFDVCIASTASITVRVVHGLRGIGPWWYGTWKCWITLERRAKERKLRRFSRLPSGVPSKCSKGRLLPCVTARLNKRMSSMPSCGDDIISSAFGVGGRLFRCIFLGRVQGGCARWMWSRMGELSLWVNDAIVKVFCANCVRGRK